jgi:hypothetical protein
MSLPTTIRYVILKRGYRLTPEGLECLESIFRSMYEDSRSRQEIIDEWPHQIAYYASQTRNLLEYVLEETLQMAGYENRDRNNLMGTRDPIDSYDICRAIFFDPDLREIVGIPEFPYKQDPDPLYLPPGINGTPGCLAALSVYFQIYPGTIKYLVGEINQKTSQVTFGKLLPLLPFL